MTSLSNQPYKGTRDYYPEDKLLQNYIFDTWRKAAEGFGYEEYGTPLLEPLELYAAKSGQDLVNDETYRFMDRGGREVAIRPEMTPSVARMIAARQQETSYPARWYSIANFMRYERPQRGREREFWQLNADIFGVEGIEADIEIISLADKTMKAFGAKESMYTIKVNHRQLIDFTMRNFLGLDAVQAQLMIKLFDKKNKMPPQEFKEKIIDIFDPTQLDEGLQKIASLFKAAHISELPQAIRNNEIFAELKDLFNGLERAGVKNVQFDITLMRGLDYYTGVVFEVFDNHPDNNRSMFGGGRYDGLTTVFGADNIPVVGFAPGGLATEIFLQSHNLIPQLVSKTEVYLIPLGGVLEQTQKLAQRLREEEVNVAVDILDRKIDKQIKTATKQRTPFVLFVGEEELASESYTLKELASGHEQKLSFERAVSIIKDKRSHAIDF